jgi:energy-coupling factor transporter ATP-binding protein EcfA2
MSVTVQRLIGEQKQRVEYRLGQILTAWDHGELTVSPICAHVILESASALKAKKAAKKVLSSSTVFLTAMIFSARLADEGLPDMDAAEHDEQARLRAWGAALRDDYSEVMDSMVAEFFATRPQPTRSVFENIASGPPPGIKLGPGLARTLDAAAGPRALDTPTLLLRLARDEGSEIARRLREKQAQDITALLEAPPSPAVQEIPRGWRHTHMFREAEEDELVLGVKDYAMAIATVLRTAKGEFTFALLGRWGSGKTTLTTQLAPLLCDARHYRKAIGVSDEIEDSWARRSYRAVKHNAWKYRSPPEAWVYAYKSLADEAARDFGPIGRLLLALRTSVHRRGMWPITGALFMLALLALPLTAKLQLLIFAVSVAGFSAMLYLGAVSTSVSGKVKALFAKHLRLTQVDERLGMLALVGDDVRALLAGWTRGLKEDSDDRQRPDLPPGRLVLPVLAILVVALVWAVGLSWSDLPVPKDSSGKILAELIPHPWAQAIGPLQNAKPGPASLGQWLVFALWLLLALAMLALPWLALWGRPNRILLVIDDLDRCTASEMLNVIEAMKLLVDDPMVNRRLQVLMLVDESVLNHAIAIRYAAMIKDRAADFEGDAQRTAREMARDEIIAEQNEKLFACHLRLAPMNEKDIEEVVTSLADRELRESPGERNPAQGPGGEGGYISSDPLVQMVGEGLVPPQVAARNAEAEARDWERRQVSDQEVVRDELNEGLGEGSASDLEDAEVRFTASEIEDLRLQVPAYLKALKRRPSPRAIRILLFKIQLCRLLLQLRYPREPGERTVARILAAFKEASETPVQVGLERATLAIARQVI